jgi:hypothetical protein
MALAKRALGILLCAVSSFPWLACDAADDDASLDGRVVMVQARRVMPGTDADPIAGARAVRMTVEGPDMEPATTTYDFVQNSQGQLPRFKPGADRQVTVEVCTQQCDSSEDGDVIARGRSVPVDVLPGETGAPATVFVGPRNAFLPAVYAASDGVSTVPSQMVRKDRLGATVTTLDDGRLLIVGGATKKAAATTWFMASDIESLHGDAEIYDPATGKFTATSAPLNIPRAFHQAVKLGGPANPDGRVLIMGGYENETGSIKPSKSIEVFDPWTGRFEEASAGLAGAGRALFTAALASPNNGDILVVGGVTSPPSAGGTWHVFRARRVKDGTFYGTIAAGPLMESTDGHTGQIRYNPTRTVLEDNGSETNGEGVPAYVLIGGENNSGTIGTVETYLPVIDQDGIPNLLLDETAMPELPHGGRTLHASVYVPSLGLIYVIGGFWSVDLIDPTSRVEAYWVGKKTFEGDTGLELGSARGGLTATLTDASTILVAGGYGGSGPTADTDALVVTRECSQPGEPPQESCALVPRVLADGVPTMDGARAGHLALLDGTRRVLLLGGLSGDGQSLEPVLFNPD